ncbi:MAG: hypothetical protein LRZ85_01530 [Alphaproteobacteria bacterium]|nr:hypothetical protein [Alphaproteobacteria bacterium]MCD8525776.1 hypothetical protein [Alphaproteobacteria bacterium]
MSLKTDTHAHFAGVLDPQDIMDLGMEYNLPIKLDVLGKLGIDIETYIKKGKPNSVSMANNKYLSGISVKKIATSWNNILP